MLAKLKTEETHIVPELSEPIRLQEYGVGIFNACLTKSALKKALKKKYIRVNGQIASTATFIRGAETITLTISEEKVSRKKLILPLKVIYEDDYLAVIHKPAGILVSGNSFFTVANALLDNIKPSKLPDSSKPQPVHRLDFATTGILMVGKTSESIRVLNKMFQDKEVEKTYFAVTIGEMELSGTISTDIDGKKSISHFQVLETVSSERFGNLNLVKLNLETGRRHQLRIHLSSIGNPILGDKDYGKENLILTGKGLYLHAFSLSFIHPFTNENMYFEDELPKRFRKIFNFKGKE